MNPKVSIYTDGSIQDTHPFYGGWAGVIVYNNTTKEISGSTTKVTSNRAELLAIYFSLRSLLRRSTVDIYTDSKSMASSFDKLELWHASDWTISTGRRSGTSVKNVDLWTKIYELSKIHSVKIYWIRGHQKGNDIHVTYHRRADTLASYAKHSAKPGLYTAMIGPENMYSTYNIVNYIYKYDDSKIVLAPNTSFGRTVLSVIKPCVEIIELPVLQFAYHRASNIKWCQEAASICDKVVIFNDKKSKDIAATIKLFEKLEVRTEVIMI